MSGTYEIDWGDGEQTTFTADGSSQSIEKNSDYVDGQYDVRITLNNPTIVGSERFVSFSSANSGNKRDKISNFIYQNGLYNMIGTYAFAGNVMENIIIPNEIEKIGANAFQNSQELTNITIPGRIVDVVGYMFSTCKKLISVTVEEGIKNIGNYCFNNCSSLTNVSLPNSLTKINDSAFAYCEALTNITIPEGVKEIGDGALQIGSKTNQATITFKSTTPPSIQSNSMLYNYTQEIRVPASAVDTYKTATNWTTLASKIVADV